jgi:prepilin-type N-terminal cleavage/methylation domain-containing protein
MRKFLKNRILKSKRGFTLVEVLVAVALLGIVLPLTFELFSLGANLMGKSNSMEENKSDVSYSVETGKAVTGVTSSTIPSYEPTFTASFEGDDFDNQRINVAITYSAKKKGEVTYYTYD